MSSEQRRKIEEILAARIPRPGSEEIRRSTPLQGRRKVLRIRRAWQLCCVCSTPRAMPLAIKTDWEARMNMPGFTAEASLGPAKGKYQGNAIFDSSGAVRVLPMQESTAASIVTQWGRRVWCCSYDSSGKPRCTYYTVPFWYWCRIVYNPLPCFICYPPESSPAI